MIVKARALDPLGRYLIVDLLTWKPPERVDLVVSMEVLSYLDDPVVLLRRIATTWLKPGGCAITLNHGTRDRRASCQRYSRHGRARTVSSEARVAAYACRTSRASSDAAARRCRPSTAAARPSKPRARLRSRRCLARLSVRARSASWEPGAEA